MISALALALCTAAAPTPGNVYAGVYLTDVSDFDLKAGRFKADLHVWVKWLGDEKDVPPVTYENGELDGEPVELGSESEGAWHSKQWRVQGTFRGEFPVQAFPFDRQTLPIILGLAEDHGRLVPDLGASGMSPSFSVSGWRYEPFFSARAEERVYRSDLGSVWREGRDAKQRLATFSVEMHRPFGPYLIKFALPLVLLLLVALLGLFLPAERLDVRSAMGITALLSCIAFHYTQADTLPNVTYLVAADKLFLGAYVFVASTLVISIISFRFYEQRPDAARLADRLGLWMLPVLTVLGLVNLVSGALSREAEVEPKAPVSAHASQPLLRVGVSALDSLGGGGQLPPRRAQLVVRASDGNFRPVLAVEAPSMTNSLVRLLPDGGMRVRWRLRADAVWSDGARITAEDLVFSLSLVPDPLRTSIERVDERTVDVTYSARHSERLAGIPMFPKSGAGFSPDGGRDGLAQANNEGKLATAGPFVSTSFEKGKAATFTRNERFAGLKPVFEKIDFRVVSPLEGAEALLKGELDVLPSLAGDAYAKLKGDARVRVLEQPGDMCWVLVPNLSQAPWDELAQRQALMAALDREAMARLLAPAPARAATGWRLAPPLPLPPAVPLTAKTLKLYVGPIRAKDETHALLAQRVVEDLARAGVTVELIERPELFQAVQRGELDGWALLGRDTSDFTRFLNVRDVTKVALPHYDEEMVERVEAIQGSLYAERRRALELELQEAWFKRLPLVPLVLTSRLAAVRAELAGPDWGVADSLWWNVAEWHLR